MMKDNCRVDDISYCIKPKISVIIPVHNAGEHIHKCLQTLINQTLKEIEIIIVLDCPTDGTEKIVKHYAETDSRIVVIENSENLHIGVSRNKGLEIARGEYIGFSDHDDYRNLDMYEKLYNIAIKEQSDIVVSPPTNVYRERIVTNYFPETEDDFKEKLLKVLIGKDFNDDSIEWDYFIGCGGMWDKLYKTELIRVNDICFEDTRKTTFEDLLFLIQAVFFSNRVSLLNEPLYYHVCDINNTSSKYFYFSYGYIFDYLRKLYDFLLVNNIYEVYKIRFSNNVANRIFMALRNEFVNQNTFFNIAKLIIMLKRESIVKSSFRAVYGFRKFYSNHYNKFLVKYIFLFLR